MSIAAMLDGENRNARTGLSLAILMGTALLGAIISVQPSCEGDRRFVDQKLRDLFKAALSDGG
jgi:hypothetical protein